MKKMLSVCIILVCALLCAAPAAMANEDVNPIVLRFYRDGVDVSAAEFLDEIEEDAREGSPEAMYLIGAIYDLGLGVPADYQKSKA